MNGLRKIYQNVTYGRWKQLNLCAHHQGDLFDERLYILRRSMLHFLLWRRRNKTYSSVKRNVNTSVWMVCTTFMIISAFRYYRSQIMVVVEREWSKPAENHPTLITNCLQETLVLTPNTKNDENIKILWKTSILTLANELFVLWHS